MVTPNFNTSLVYIHNTGWFVHTNKHILTWEGEKFVYTYMYNLGWLEKTFVLSVHTHTFKYTKTRVEKREKRM